MGKQFLKYAGGLIALYLLVAYSTGAGKVINAGSAGSSGLVRAFQGR